MVGAIVWPRLFAGGETVVDVPPIIGGGVCGIDTDGLDTVDHLQNTFDLWPTVNAQKNLAAGTDEWQRRGWFARRSGAHNVDPRNDGAKIVRRPADEREDAAGRKAYDAPLPVDDLIVGEVTEANPALNLLFDPGQLNMGKPGCRVGRRLALYVSHDAPPWEFGDDLAVAYAAR